jgi:hypothetical protein
MQYSVHAIPGTCTRLGASVMRALLSSRTLKRSPWHVAYWCSNKCLRFSCARNRWQPVLHGRLAAPGCPPRACALRATAAARLPIPVAVMLFTLLT